eukprot:CAMPEP_0184741082 /NCGR_PEP_ID=MMETSP0315-20130426/4169_1 /TAXON_ID=101924 /ORGANISM="Rhodosorus marinus, Strain UTEX LB 2760" /LENGTH=57 /DNA_ID=CAMNT_0027211219 /DNA_START=8 /DNA_END=181 /DNA_ORIENTATION=+
MALLLSTTRGTYQSHDSNMGSPDLFKTNPNPNVRCQELTSKALFHRQIELSNSRDFG